MIQIDVNLFQTLIREEDNLYFWNGISCTGKHNMNPANKLDDENHPESAQLGVLLFPALFENEEDWSNYYYYVSRIPSAKVTYIEEVNPIAIYFVCADPKVTIQGIGGFDWVAGLDIRIFETKKEVIRHLTAMTGYAIGDYGNSMNHPLDQKKRLDYHRGILEELCSRGNIHARVLPQSF